jgi:hypothetical protein
MKIKLIQVLSVVRKRLLYMIMRTFIFLLCTTVFGFNTENLASQEQVNINKDQIVTVDQVFEIIKNQTNYKFLYPQDLFKNAPKVHLKKGIIFVSKLLEKSFRGSNVNFELSDNNTIVIKESEATDVSKKITKKQQFQVSGKVVDQNNQPLPGANILVKGTTKGTQTDFDGAFTLDLDDGNSTLVISYIGYTTLEVPLNGQNTITIKLSENAAALDEIVVVGWSVAAWSRSACF